MRAQVDDLASYPIQETTAQVDEKHFILRPYAFALHKVGCRPRSPRARASTTLPRTPQATSDDD